VIVTGDNIVTLFCWVLFFFSLVVIILMQYALLRRMKEENMYVCGDPMADDSDLVTLMAINCTSDVEIAYYSSDFTKVVSPVCCYCGI